MEKRISGRTGLYCLIGSPVGHSGSPGMYNFSFAHHDLDDSYMAFDVKIDQVPSAIEAIKLFNVKGFNVTMPCKSEVAKYVDELSPAARIIGAVNTVVNEQGKLIGHITDGMGFVRNLKEHGIDVMGKKLVVLGSGGAATAIQVQSALEGAESIAIFARDDEFFPRALETAEKLKTETPDCQVNVYRLEDSAVLREQISKADILVNGTIIGMKPFDDMSLVDKSFLRDDLVVADAIYNPPKTKLILEAEEVGCIAIGGEGMLLWQGVEAFKLFTGKELPAKEYQEFKRVTA